MNWRPSSRVIPWFLRAAVLAGILALGCTKESSGPTSTGGPSPLTTIIVSPSSDTLVVFATQLFTAVGKDGAGSVLALTPTWSMANGEGTINAAGLFTAGASAGTSVVQVQSGSLSAFAAVTVAAATTPPGTLASISVTPNPVTLAALGTQQFTAVGKDGVGTVVGVAPTWSVASGDGTISSAGLFTAGMSAGTSVVRATSGSIVGSAAVTVTSGTGTLASITVTPNPDTLGWLATQQFTAVGKDGVGNVVVFTPTWSVASGDGAINSTGMFAAGASPGMSVVRATSGSIVGSGAVTVIAPGPVVRITVTPNPDTLVVLSTQQFTAVGRDPAGHVVAIAPVWNTYSGGDGTISTAGVFTAGASPASTSVWASVGGLSGVATVVVIARAGTLQSIAVAPPYVVLWPGATQQFTAAGHDPQGNVVATTFTWSASGGTISNTGLFRAGTAPGGYSNNITATSGTVSGHASTTVSPTNQLAFLTQPDTTPVGHVITPAVRVVARDSAGNTLTGFTGPVTIADNEGGHDDGALTGTLTVSAVNGIATFSDLRVGQPSAGWALYATATGFYFAASGRFAVLGATPRRLAFVEQPYDLPPSGGTFHISVVVQDSIGNTVVTYSGPITLSIGANPGGATPLALSMPAWGGPASSGFTPGVANFGWLRLDQPGMGYTLVAAADGLASATSVPFDMCVTWSVTGNGCGP